MVQNVLIFLPDSLRFTKNGYLEGYRQRADECDAFYVTNDNTVKETGHVIGYVNDDVNRTKIIGTRSFIHVDSTTTKITLINYSTCTNLVKVIYDYEAFRSCDRSNLESDCGPHFKFLSQVLYKTRHKHADNGHTSVAVRILTFAATFLSLILQKLDMFRMVWSYSATISQFHDNLVGYRWLCSELIGEKRVSPKIGNFILSKLVDLCLGVILVRLLRENEEFVVRCIENGRETIIFNFRHLLLYLMGSPIGLKLNYAFDNSLGKFFFYHIALWRVFLVTMQPLVKYYFKFLMLPGLFGFSYQVAMLSDLISVATFHVYCIYVYAARLISLQLKGLLSLWRLFIGRKHNPLRNRVDSHRYSQHQLFIGTLGFTVLLFLLPTTAMYYAVFVIFRLGILVVGEFLIRVRLLLSSLPLYVVFLWTIRSTQISGPVHLVWKKNKNGTASFRAHLEPLPLLVGVKKFKPGTNEPRTGPSLSKVLTGVLL